MSSWTKTQRSRIPYSAI